MITRSFGIFTLRTVFSIWTQKLASIKYTSLFLMFGSNPGTPMLLIRHITKKKNSLGPTSKSIFYIPEHSKHKERNLTTISKNLSSILHVEILLKLFNGEAVEPYTSRKIQHWFKWLDLLQQTPHYKNRCISHSVK